jgi:hypothetical protein
MCGAAVQPGKRQARACRSRQINRRSPAEIPTQHCRISWPDRLKTRSLVIPFGQRPNDGVSRTCRGRVSRRLAQATIEGDSSRDPQNPCSDDWRTLRIEEQADFVRYRGEGENLTDALSRSGVWPIHSAFAPAVQSACRGTARAPIEQRCVSFGDAWRSAPRLIGHLVENHFHEGSIVHAAEPGIGVVEKGLVRHRLPIAEAIRFVLANPNVASRVVGGMNLQHFGENVRAANEIVARRR